MLSRLDGRGQDTSSAVLGHVPKAVKPGFIDILFHRDLEQHLKHIGKKFYSILASWLVCFHHPAKCCGDWGEYLWTACVNWGSFFLLQAVFELNPLIKEQLSHSFLLVCDM